jgi:hypothetical protein
MHDSPRLTNGVRITFRRPGFGRAVVVLALVTVALATACVGPAVAAPHRGSTAEKRHRAVQRKALLRAVSHDPKIATRPGFLRKAALFGVDVPITIRLNPPTDQAGTPGASDDAVKISFDPAPSDPALPTGVTPGIVASTITGGWTGTLRFSADTSGYGGIGVIELGFRKVALAGTGFDLIQAADPAPCIGGPALLRTPSIVDITSGLQSQGYVDVFRNTFDIALHTQFSFAAERRDDCSLATFGTTAVMTGDERPPVPMRFSGAFRISPALTTDGYVRLGRLALRGVQSDSYVELHTCTDASVAPPPCPPDSKLTGRLVASSFTADLLIGTLPL